MSIFILEISSSEFSEMPYDRIHLLVVEATNEENARRIAYQYDSDYYSTSWIDPERSSCKLISELPSKNGILKSWGWGSA